MTEFPAMVYKSPGKHLGAGGSYDFAGVENAEELQAKLKDGWFSSLPEAIESENKEETAKEDDTAPASRQELEEKATELGVKFDGRFSDKKIAQLIEAALQ
jgi:hypothetical protein